MRIPVLIASVGTLFIFLGGCFFTEEINEAPVPGIRPLETGPYHLGDTLRFNATKTVDDVTNDLNCEWLARSCSGSSCTVLREMRGAIDTTFEVPIESHESIEIQLRVTDEFGATRLQPDVFRADVSNRDPSVNLQITGHREEATNSYILYRPINIVVIPGVAASDEYDLDGDEVELSWQLLAPPSSQEDQRSFVAVGDEGYILVPDVAGEWSVVLSADDGFGGTDQVRRDFFVGVDSPPCLQSIEPTFVQGGYYLVASGEGARSFSVLSVVDALDPFPAPPGQDEALGEATFRWLIREPGAAGFTVIAGHGAPRYEVDPLAYKPGDRLELRVEVQDRVSGPERDLTCAEDNWACELSAGSECFQRLTWGVQIQ